MFLSRIVGRVRNLHWTAIGVDFVIVVVGVFIGMQVSNWNDERNLAQRKLTALDRLHGELESDINYLQERATLLQGANELRTEALRRLVAGDWTGADRDNTAKAFDTAVIAPSVSPPQGIYNELIHTGLFADLGDAKFRDAMSAYVAYLSFVQGQVAYIREGMIARNIGHGHAGVQVRFDPSAPRQQRTEYDLQALSKDGGFTSIMIDDHSDQIAQWQWTSNALARAKAACAEIARVDGRPCGSGKGP